jgi:hypothetical protein
MSIPLFGQMAHKTHVITDAGIRPLTGVEKLMLLILDNAQRRQGPYAEASMDELAHLCGCSQDTVRRAQRSLEGDKVLKVDRPAVSAHGHKFRYVIDEDRLCWREPTKKGSSLLPLKGSILQNEGLHPATHNLIAFNTSTKTTGTGTSSPSPKSVEVPTSDRPTESRPDGRKKSGKSTAEELAILEVLERFGVPRDPFLPRSIWKVAECKGEHLPLTDILAWLAWFLATRPNFAGVNPSAIITAAVREYAHSDYLGRPEPPPQAAAGCTCGRRGKCEYCQALPKVN